MSDNLLFTVAFVESPPFEKEYVSVSVLVFSVPSSFSSVNVIGPYVPLWAVVN